MRKEIEVGDHMKNDFRDFYDEDYIMHKAYENSTEEELMHGEWLNKFRKYIDKIRTRSGKWRYIYPEDVKDKLTEAKNNLSDKVKAIKRDTSYAARNLRSRLNGGENKRFKSSNPYSGYTVIRDDKVVNKRNAEQAISNEKEQRKARKGLAKYNNRHASEISNNKIEADRSEQRKENKLSAASRAPKRKEEAEKRKILNKQMNAGKVTNTAKSQNAKIYQEYANKQRKKERNNRINASREKENKELSRVLNDINRQRSIVRRKAKGIPIFESLGSSKKLGPTNVNWYPDGTYWPKSVSQLKAESKEKRRKWKHTVKEKNRKQL